jgi:hypothetical protein
MDTSALKTFAPEVRRRLLDAVERKLDFVLTGDTADLRAAAAQVERLRAQAAAGRTQLIERVAYTWFNRLAALRFLDARGWHPFRVRVLTAASLQETQPEILRQLRGGVLPDELKPHTDLARLNNLLDGRLPSFDPQAEAYRHLVLAACRYYHALLPFLFERLDDETELLLPDDLLTEHSVAQGFRTEISDDDCAEVEVLGWLYQFYTSEKKDQVMARKAAVPSEDIPAVTQLFTPHWIVRYLVENSLGRLWLRSRPGSALRASMPYYVDGPDGQAPADSLTVNRPEEICILDPACGSGHMLTYAFDLLYQMYEEEGHAPNEIPEKILTHNLYGLEICPRATQLAQFALLAKSRERSSAAFREPVQPQVMCLHDVAFDPDELRAWREASALTALITEEVLTQLYQFREDTATLGSLIRPVLDAEKIGSLKIAIVQAPAPTDLLLAETQRKVLLALDQAETLSQRYHVVVTNPPYMGSGQMAPELREFAKGTYRSSKADLFAMFIERACTLAIHKGFCSLITMHSWMFLQSFEALRLSMLSGGSIVTMAHMGARAFDSIGGEVVQTTAWLIENRFIPGSAGFYFRLVDGRTESEKETLLRETLDGRGLGTTYIVRGEQFRSIPSSPIAYWVSDSVRRVFAEGTPFRDIGNPRVGMQTSNNGKYLRLWYEVAWTESLGDDRQRRKWIKYLKGGPFRRWYGNLDYLLRYEGSPQYILEQHNATVLPESRLLDCKCTWTDLTSGSFNCRISPNDAFHDISGHCFYPSPDDQMWLLSYANTKQFDHFIGLVNSSFHFQVGDVGKMPVLPVDRKQAAEYAHELVEIARADWDNFETSWDFRDLPLLRSELKGPTLEASWHSWETFLRANIVRMQELETENNRLWIEAYGLEDEFTPEVPKEEITLARPDRRKDVAAFLSYAVGCMMGRYSLDKPGLVLADAGDTLESYLAKVGRPRGELSFAPDEDGIIPVLDGEWFEDDIAVRTRDFLRATFGDATLEENLRFIEDSLGRELHRYFAGDFYKDHLQTYKKRPLYWMFQSPKKSFQCLVYLHRFTRDTPHLVLNRYLREYLAKIGYRLEHLDHVLASESTPPREKTRARKESDELRKTLRECEEWEREVLLPLAQRQVELNLDDGVKVNYLKLGKALAPILGLAGKGGDA